MRLDMRKPLKDHEFGELAHLDNYPAMIDQEEYDKMQEQQEMMMQDPMGMGACRYPEGYFGVGQATRH